MFWRRYQGGDERSKEEKEKVEEEVAKAEEVLRVWGEVQEVGVSAGRLLSFGFGTKNSFRWRRSHRGCGGARAA